MFNVQCLSKCKLVGDKRGNLIHRNFGRTVSEADESIRERNVAADASFVDSL